MAENWAPSDGTRYVDKLGYEDGLAYFVIGGAREGSVDGDTDYLMLDDRAIIVSKLTGEVFEFDALADAPRLDAMSQLARQEKAPPGTQAGGAFLLGLEMRPRVPRRAER